MAFLGLCFGNLLRFSLAAPPSFAMAKSVYLRIAFGILLGWALAGQLPAQEVAPSFVLDLPVSANLVTPAWLGAPQLVSAPFATLSVPLVPPAGESLLVTVFFQEKSGGFLRISWQGEGAAPVASSASLPGPGEAAASAVLTDNFYEGIAMSNQRSLLVPEEVMKSAGQLVFQCGGGTLDISRIKFEWLQSSTGLASGAITDVLVTTADGKTQLADDLAGLPPNAEDPAWHDRIVDVPVTSAPLRIEQGVDFTVQLTGAPATARLSLKEAGLPWGQHLIVWINGQRCGIVMPAVPSLQDPGYSPDPSSPYIGWREGTFYVPAGLLTSGNDTLQFSAEADAPSGGAAGADTAEAPLAVKDVAFQLGYPATSTPVAATPATGNSPAGQVTDAPDTSSSPPPVSAPPTNDDQPSNSSSPALPAVNPQSPGLLSLPTNLPSSTLP